MDYVKIISNIMLDDDINKLRYDDNELEFMYKFWDYIRYNDYENIDKIKNIFIEKRTINEYNLFVRIIKKLNSDFYAFEYFRDEKINNLNKIFLLNKIFKEFCLSNCENELVLFMTNELKIDQNVSNEILYWFLEALDFSIQNNYNGKRFINILEETYLLKETILVDLIKLYDDNLMMLKLNYIIKKLNTK